MCAKRYPVPLSHRNYFEFSGRLLSAKFQSDSQWYLICWYFIWFTTILLQSPTLLFLLYHRISSLNNALLSMNSLYIPPPPFFLSYGKLPFALHLSLPTQGLRQATSLLCDTGQNWVSEGKKKRKCVGKSCRKPPPIFFKKSVLM